MATTRKTAAQKAAEAEARDLETMRSEENDEVEGERAAGDSDLTSVTDDKGKRLTVQQLKNKLRNEAERETLDEHRPEVIKRTAAKYKAHNLEYVRRLTDEEKAAKAIEEYYRKFPNLRPETIVADPAPEGAYQGRDAGRVEVISSAEHEALVQAEQGGALNRFRDGGYSYEHGQPDGDQ